MNFGGILLIVSDIDKAKAFYENVLEQKISMDLQDHVSFENGLGLQANYGEILHMDLEIKKQSNNFQMYFEVDHVEAWEEKLHKVEGISFLHNLQEYPWGQRSFRIYDYDKHIIEIAESMERVVIRFLAQGMTVEETSQRTMFPITFVQQFQ